MQLLILLQRPMLELIDRLSAHSFAHMRMLASKLVVAIESGVKDATTLSE